MHRRRGLTPRSQVASGIATVRGRNLQIVVVVDVAQLAGHVRMAIGEWKSRGAVVELHLQPTVRRVAQIAGGRETCAGVVGIGSFLKVRQMA